ncbi:MAG TPA: cytochrome b [Gammaproteobacteria bacterium]|nr:cytochrome b [Gammaproteobacteria bacterium]
MQIKNSQNRYGIVAIWLHWLMAILIIGLLALGLYMVGVPLSHWKLKLYGWHKEFGMLVLLLLLLRLAWRLGNIIPLLPETIPRWQKRAARVVHWLFYGFMIALPVSGWLITSAAGLPVSFFGLFVLPNLVSPSENRLLLFTEVHEWLSYALIATLCLHILAALKHHFIDRDDTLKKIL